MELDFPEIVADKARTEVAVAAATALDLSKIDLTDVALAQFGKWRDEVAHATKTLTGVVHDLSTPTKLADAKSLRARVVGAPRAEARKVAVELKSKLAKVSKAIGAEVDTIVAAWDEVEKLITPQIEARDAEIAAEKEAARKREAEAAAKEEARKKEIRDAIAVISNYATLAIGKDSATLKRGIEYVEGLTIDEALFQEFTALAVVAKNEALRTMQDLHAKALADEEDARQREAQRIENERQAAQLAAERAEFERQRAEFAAQQEAARKAAEPTPLQALQASVEASQQPAVLSDALEERFGDRLDDKAPLADPNVVDASFDPMVPGPVEIVEPAPEMPDMPEPAMTLEEIGRLEEAAALAADFGTEQADGSFVFDIEDLADLIDAIRAA